MSYHKLLYFSFLLLLASCKGKSGFSHDPAVPYPLFNPGDFWADKFDQRGLQNAVVYQDKLYCNTIDVGGDENFLYCLNPKNGLVIWRVSVEAFATQPVSVYEDKIVYCSYLGDISVINNKGKLIWKAKFKHPYGGHWMDTSHAELLVTTVYWKNVSHYELNTGKLISDNESDSLQKLIDLKRNNEIILDKYEYRFTREGKTYTIICRPPGPGEGNDCKVDINRTKG